MIQKGPVTKILLGKLPLIDTLFKRVAVDIVSPIEPWSDKSWYILTMIDYMMEYPEVVPSWGGWVWQRCQVSYITTASS